MARPGIEPSTSDVRVRCPTNCATRPGTFSSNEIPFLDIIKREHLTFLAACLISQQDSDRDPENVSLIRLSVSDGQKKNMHFKERILDRCIIYLICRV